jgi:hypothetical protein
MIEKILLIAALVFAAVSMLMGGVLAVQSSRISTLKQTLSRISAENTQCKESIGRQNTLIEAYQIDIANARAEAQSLSALIDDETKEQKVKVVERLIKDNSCEERLALVEEILDDFYRHY